MLMNIALGVVTCLLVVTGFHLFENGKVFDYITDSDGTKRRKLSFLTKAGANGWIAGAITGAVLAFINYFTGKITLSTIWLAWVFLVIIAIGYVLLAWWWKNQEGCEVSEGICFFLISMTPFLTARSLVGITTAPWKNVFLTRLFCTLPILLVLAELVFMIISAIKVRGGGQKLKWIVSGVALMLVVLFITASLTGCSTTDTKAAEKIYENQAVESLTVRKLTPEDLEKLTLSKYKDIPETLLDSSLSPKDKERTSKTGMSDALTFGFESKDTAKMFKELEAEILRNPVYGVTVANALRDKKIGDRAIGDFNGWMNEMAQKNSNGVFIWCEYRDNDSKTIYVTEEYRCYAATLCTFLERLVGQGVQTRQTIENWCLNSAAKNNDRAGIKAEYQYKKEAFILAYVGKNEAGDKNPKGLLVIGFNVHDKRPEFFTEEDKPEIVNTPPSGGSDTPTPSPGSDTPTKPSGGSDPPTPTNPPTPTPTYNKDPNKAPSENTEKNDDTGPGPDTNNGVGATTSTKDNPNNSNHYDSYGDYRKDMDEMENINQNQKTGNDGNAPSSGDGSSANVDNNADDGTGYGGINIPTPVQDSAQTSNGHKVANDSPGEAWGGPPD